MLTEDQIKFYKENGYLLIENAIPPKLLKVLQDILMSL